MWTLMAGFNSYSFCARCRDKGKGKDPCVENPQSTDCNFCNTLTSDQHSQLSTPSYKFKKEKREARKETLITLTKDNSTLLNPSLMDPASVLVIGLWMARGRCSLLVIMNLQKTRQKRWKRTRVQLPKPSHHMKGR